MDCLFDSRITDFSESDWEGMFPAPTLKRALGPLTFINKLFKEIGDEIAARYRLCEAQAPDDKLLNVISGYLFKKRESFDLNEIEEIDAPAILESAFRTGQPYIVDALLFGPLRGKFQPSFRLRGQEWILNWVRAGNNGPFANRWMEELGAFDRLSGFDQVLLRVAAGWKEGVERPGREFYAVVETLSDAERGRLYKAAFFQYRFPFLPEPADPGKIVRSNAYSINFISFYEGSVFSSKFHDEMAPKVREWSRLNPETTIHVWFDSNFSPAVMVRELGEEYGRQDGYQTLLFRDIRELSFFKEESDYECTELFGPEIQVYNRVDLAKVLIGLADRQICVISDWDLLPISHDELFCKNTISCLERIGFIFGETIEGKMYENGFVITNGFYTGERVDRDSFHAWYRDLRHDLDYEEAQSVFLSFYQALDDDFKIKYPDSSGMPIKPVPMPKSHFST